MFPRVVFSDGGRRALSVMSLQKVSGCDLVNLKATAHEAQIIFMLIKPKMGTRLITASLKNNFQAKRFGTTTLKLSQLPQI